jgi:hypothetical protein
VKKVLSIGEQIEFKVQGEVIRAETGTCIMAPIGVPYAFYIPTDKPAQFLITIGNTVHPLLRKLGNQDVVYC